MNKIILKCLSLFLISFSIFIMLIYLNYLVIGYNFFQYVKFISVYIVLILVSILILYLIR